jgi:glycine/D-amino acid oxidase-like deaminating enzyme
VVAHLSPYYLSQADPTVRIAVLEAEICGYGASGRNGGWCSALFRGGRRCTP